jgi:hypothetical protein
MTSGVRLSEASAEVTAALAGLDGAALTELTERLTAIAEGRLAVEPERSEVVERELRILEGVLLSTEENIQLLRSLQARKVSYEWGH